MLKPSVPDSDRTCDLLIASALTITETLVERVAMMYWYDYVDFVDDIDINGKL